MNRPLIFKAILFLILQFASTVLPAQFITTTRGWANITVHISEESTLSDLRVLLVPGTDSADFSIRFTYDQDEADFILSRGLDANLAVGLASLEKADLRIQAGEFVSRPQVTVNVIRDGDPDYLVYIDQLSFGLNEVIMAILPAINKALDYRYDLIPRIE